GGGGTGVAQQADTGLEAEGRGTQVGVLQAVVGRVRGDEVGEGGLAITLNGPVELAAVDKRAAEGGTVAGVELGQGGDDDVRAQLDRADEGGGGDGVVDDQRHLVAVCHLGDSRDVQDIGLRVGEGLTEEGDGVV